MPSAAKRNLRSYKTRRWKTDAERPTRIDATPTQDFILANMSPRKPQDTTLENRR
jgi:hypothetical protein